MIATRVTLSVETVIATVRRTEGGLAAIHTAHQVCPVCVLQHTILCTCLNYVYGYQYILYTLQLSWG